MKGLGPYDAAAAAAKVCSAGKEAGSTRGEFRMQPARSSEVFTACQGRV